MTDNISSQSQASRPGGAIVVDVVNGNLCHAELVKDSLSAGGISVAVTCYSLVNIVVVDLGIKHSLDTCLKTKLRVVDFSPGLNELGHAYAKDVAWLAAFDNHCGGWVVGEDELGIVLYCLRCYTYLFRCSSVCSKDVGCRYIKIRIQIYVSSPPHGSQPRVGTRMLGNRGEVLPRHSG